MKLCQEIIDKIKNESKQKFVGTEGRVYLSDDYALKEFTNVGITSAEKLKQNLDDLKTITNELKDEHFVNTPKIYDYMVNNEPTVRGYLLMEKAKGSPVYADVNANLRILCPEYNEIYRCDLISKYGLRMAEKLADAQQWQYDNLVEDAYSILDDRRIMIDNFGENLYYDEKSGFSYLDLQKDERKVRAKSGGRAFRDALSLVSLDYVSCLLYAINGKVENVDPVKVVKPIYDKTMKSLSKYKVTNKNLSYYVKMKVRDLM